MVEQVIGEAEEHPAILAVQHNREADLSVGDHHDARDRPEDAAAVLDDAVAAIILHVPAERIGLLCRLRGLELGGQRGDRHRSEEHTSELQSLMRISYAVFCLKKKKQNTEQH